MDSVEFLGDEDNLGLGTPRIEIRPVVANLHQCIPEHLAQRYRCVPKHVEGNVLFLAMSDPTDLVAIDDVRLITGYEIEPVATDPAEIDALLGGFPASAERASFPLQECRVEAHLSGPLASVEVVHRFANLLEEPMEAMYVFPLPGGAAVHAFRMQVGERVVEGVVQSRNQARHTYSEGKREGHRVALLEQSRDNVVTAFLGNLPPGEEVTIELSYVERVEQNLCENVFRFPLVVAPRYGDGPEAPPRAAHVATFQLGLTLDAAGPLKRLGCSQHTVSSQLEGDGLRIELTNSHEPLNRDFVLRYAFQGDDELSSSLLVDDEHFLLTVVPPVDCGAPPAPREVAFVLDRSGSMEGLKWVSAVQATLDFLATLDEGDTFRIVAFDDRVEVFENGTVAAACRWLRKLSPRGGTDILLGLQAAASREVVLITDGQVTNEQEVYRELDTWSGRRLFTLGIDSAVNGSFLQEAARRGSGTCELVTPGERLEAALARLARETGRPLVTELRLVDRGLNFLPESPLPDLFPSRPLSISGRKLGHGPLEVAGKLASGAPWSVRVEPVRSSNPALGLLWARERILRLEHDPQQEAALEGLALQYRLLSRLTSFVLVDRAEVANPGGITVPAVQPLESPAYWCAGETMKDISCQDFGPLDFEDTSDEEISLDKLREMVDEAPIVRVVNLILTQAINDGATHVHIDPLPKALQVRYRIDGVLQEVMTPPKHIEAPLLARLRALAGLPLGQEGEGNFELVHAGRTWKLHLRAVNGKVIVRIRGDRPVELPPFLPALLERNGLVAVADRELLHAIAQHLEGGARSFLQARGQEQVADWDLDVVVAERFCDAVLEASTGVFGVPAPDTAAALAWLRQRPEVYARLTAVVAVQRPRRKGGGVLEFVEWVDMQNPDRVESPFGVQGQAALAAGETTEEELARLAIGSGRRCRGTAEGPDQSSVAVR